MRTLGGVVEAPKTVLGGLVSWRAVEGKAMWRCNARICSYIDPRYKPESHTAKLKESELGFTS